MSTSPTSQTPPAPGQDERPLLVVTCRAKPENPDLYDNQALRAGDYQLAWAHPVQTAPNAPLSFTYESWHLLSHRKTPDDILDLLPRGDVLIVVHGFLNSAPEGVSAGLEIGNGLQRTGGPGAALGLTKPASQPSALRLATTLQNQLPAAPALYRYLIAFTWPTTHQVLPGYYVDKVQIAQDTAFSLANLLSDLRASDPDRRILLVGHSMGCFLTLKALHMLAVLRAAQAPEGRSQVLIDQMVFYAPDIQSCALQSDPPLRSKGNASPDKASISAPEPFFGYQTLDRVGRLIVYYSFHDNVLIWSPLANYFTLEPNGPGGHARLGWCGPFTLATTHKNVVAVDCSDVIYDHGAYFVRHEILEHTARALAEPIPVPPQPVPPPTVLQTTKEGEQVPAHRLWTWSTPAEILREGWVRFFYTKPRWARILGTVLGWTIILAILAAIITGIIFGIIALVHRL